MTAWLAQHVTQIVVGYGLLAVAMIAGDCRVLWVQDHHSHQARHQRRSVIEVPVDALGAFAAFLAPEPVTLPDVIAKPVELVPVRPRRRHPASVTSERVNAAIARWHDQLTPAERASLVRASAALDRIAARKDTES